MGNFKNTGSDAKQCLQAIPSQRQFLALTLAVGLLLCIAPPVQAGKLDLTWDAPTTNADVDGSALTDLASYRVYYGTSASPCPGGTYTPVASTKAAPSSGDVVNYTLTGLTTGTTYFVQVSAVDTDGNESVCSNEASGPAKDDSPPTAPASLSATAASSSQITLSWTAATDNVGVTDYRVERCQGAGCSSFSQVATPTGTSYSDSGLQAGTSYSYRVRATDAAGNLSAYSNTASATSTSAAGTTSGPASLTIHTLAGTKIYLGGNLTYLGELKGSVPDNGELSIQGLVSQKYVIRATLAGFLDAYRQVSLDPGANVVSLEMAPFNSSDTLSPTLTPLKAGGVAIVGGGAESAPFVVDWDNDGKKDLLVGGGDGAIVLYQNVGSDAAPQFGASQALMADGAPISVLGPASVFVIDWDSDGNKDLLVGDGQGRIRWYRNTGTDDAPILTAWGPLQAGGVEIQVTGLAAPVVVDWNSDGRKDLLVGDGAGHVWLFLNQGTDAAPVLATGVQIALPDVGVVRSNARPLVVDWNEDGRKDLLVGDANGRTYLFLNTGTDAAPAFASGAALTGQGGPIAVSSNAAPFVVDWDNNSVRDLVIGTSNGGEVFLVAGTEPPASSSSGGEGGGGGCFIATAAYGSPLAPQVQLLREVRDRYLLRHAVGRAFVALYYRVSPPLAEVIAGSESLRAIVRMGLVPIIAWAALVLWSPAVGLAVLVAGLSLGGWLALRIGYALTSRCAGRVASLGHRGCRSHRAALLRWFTLGTSLLMFLASPTPLAGAAGGNAQGEARVEFTAEVRLRELTWLALIRDPETEHQSLHKEGEPIFAGTDPLPLGKLVTVREDALVMALPRGETVKIAKGARLPGRRVLLFVRSVLLDTLRFEVRYGEPAAPPGAEYSVTQILGRQAILQREARLGERQPAAASPAGPGLPQGQRVASARAGSPPTPKEDALATLVKTVPIREVGPDTWEVPARDAKDIGDSVGQLFTEALASATPRLTPWYGVALSVDTSLGGGTLDRRGFLVNNLTLARRAGLEMGDRILFVNEEPVNTLGGLFRLYKKLKSDAGVSEVKLVINRDNQLRTLTYRLR